MSDEQQMTIIENLSEELGEKELRIMALEKEVEKLKESIDFAVIHNLVYECPQCKYLTDPHCKKYADKKYPDQDIFRCWECRNDDTSSEEEEEQKYFCEICSFEFFTTPDEYECSEGKCPDCQKFG